MHRRSFSRAPSVRPTRCGSPRWQRSRERFRVVRYDRRGHGRSPVVAGPTTIDALGDDLVALLDALSLQRVSFCGLSLGGVEGMWLAENAPERVDRLALCCTAASFPPRQGWLDRAAVVRSEGMGAIVDAVLGRWFTAVVPRRAPRCRGAVPHDARVHAGRGICRLLRRARRRRPHVSAGGDRRADAGRHRPRRSRRSRRRAGALSPRRSRRARHVGIPGAHRRMSKRSSRSLPHCSAT